MAKRFEVELNKQGVGQLLKGKELENRLKDIASEIARDCGTGYSCDTKMMPTRVIASVYTDTIDAMQDNYNNNTLLKAVSRYRDD